MCCDGHWTPCVSSWTAKRLRPRRHGASGLRSTKSSTSLWRKFTSRRSPLNGLRWNAPAVNEEVDLAAVPNPAQVARLLAAVARQRGRGPHLEAFFGCMYYAAMRPVEVIHLRLEQCHLPETGWGMLNLSGGVVVAGKEWTDGGAVHEVHSLKRRGATATRPVPIPPQFVRMLRAHIERFGVAPDGRLFRNQAGNYMDAAAYGTTWARARKYVLTAKFLDGVREQANRLIDQSMREWDRVSQGAESEG